MSREEAGTKIPHMRIGITVAVAGLIAVFQPPAAGQSFKQAIQKMHAAFWNSHSFYTEMEIRIYDSGVLEGPEQVSRATIQKKDKAFYYAWDGRELLFNRDFALLVSHEMKTMTMYEMFTENLFSPDLMMHRVTGLLSSYKESVRELGEADDGRCYRVQPEKSWVTNIEWCVDPESGWLTRLDYSFRDRSGMEGRVETSFFNTCLDEGVSEAVFRPGYFVLKREDKWEAAGKYSGYQLLVSE